jgi:hypothetical protein
MREHSARGFWLLLCLLASAAVLVSACETTDDPASSPTTAANRATSPAVDSDMALSTPQRDVLPGAVPTRTLGPIVSFTPKFTATPIPSSTPTPTITLTPTETTEPPTVTPTLTPSPSPTASGAIRSTSAQVNVREEPNGDVVQSIPNGSELGVLDIQEGENGFDWYQVSYLPEDGEELRGWVRADLVETDFVPPAAQDRKSVV